MFTHTSVRYSSDEQAHPVEEESSCALFFSHNTSDMSHHRAKRSVKNFLDAVTSTDDIKKLTDLLDRIGLDDAVNTQRPNDGWAALHFACNKKSNVGVIKFLLEQGASVNLATDAGTTPLHLACAISGNSDAVKLLLAKGADPLVRIHETGETPLHHAYGASVSAKNDPMAVLQLLVETAGSHIVDVATHKGTTVLHQACQDGCLAVLKYLVDTGNADLCVRDDKEWTPLHYACHARQEEVVRYMNQDMPPDKKWSLIQSTGNEFGLLEELTQGSSTLLMDMLRQMFQVVSVTSVTPPRPPPKQGTSDSDRQNIPRSRIPRQTSIPHSPSETVSELGTILLTYQKEAHVPNTIRLRRAYIVSSKIFLMN